MKHCETVLSMQKLKDVLCYKYTQRLTVPGNECAKLLKFRGLLLSYQ